MAVKVGLREWHYAKVLSDTAEGTEYDTPVAVTGLMELAASVDIATDVLYSDDGPSENLQTLSGITARIVNKNVPLKIQADLLGHTYRDGEMSASKDDVPPYVAIGYKTTYNDGKSRYAWLYKGQFSPPADTNKTRGKTPEAQPDTMEGAFMPRESDGAWKHVADEHDGFTGGSTWFTEVQAPLHKADEGEGIP